MQGAVSDGVEMIKIFLPLLLILLTACAEIPKMEPVVQLSPMPKIELEKDIPNDSWVKIYFEGFETRRFDPSNLKKGGEIVKHSGLDEYARQNRLLVLRENILPENDLEIRIWVGFGLYGHDGLIIKRSSGNWSVVNLRQMLCHIDERVDDRGTYSLEVPKSGWEAMWQKLVDAEILTLPDSSKLKYEHGVLDGKSYVVETNSDYFYRTYHYGNPNYSELKEAKQMIKISEIIADEFGLESFSIKTVSCSKDE